MYRPRNKITPKLLYLALALTTALILQPANSQRQGPSLSATRSMHADLYAKIHPHLLEDIQAQSSAAVPQNPGPQQAPARPIEFIARIKAGTDLSPYVSKWFPRPFVDPTGATVAYGLASPAGLLKLASLDSVLYLQRPESLIDPPKPVDEERQRALNTMIKVKPGVNLTAAQGPTPNGWYDTGRMIHGSREAWNKGYTGKGVRVMINDSGADYCHPDLYKTWGYIEDASSPYYGLPEMFDSYSSYGAAKDYHLGETNIADGRTSYADTSTIVSGPTAAFKPLGASEAHTYRLPGGSKSGAYHIGSHPDSTLAAAAGDISAMLGGNAIKNEHAAVLVVDSKRPGVYDRVYVDLNYNFDFTDDRPARLDRSFAYHEAACLDYNHDGLFDISGGLVYFISDGRTPVPTLDWHWGVPGSYFGNGNLVAFTIMDALASSAGDHGMLCTSVAVGRARVRGSIYFGPDGPPQANGRGLVRGPGREVISIQNGNQYLSPFSEDAFIYAALGYDGKPGTKDDIQIVSNSWSISSIDNDGFDLQSRLLDALNRQTNPHMTLLFSAGNGGAGYGTLTQPKPASGIAVGASTLYDQIGIFEPISTAKQIVGGDPESWSGRGPGAVGDVGVDVIATGEGPGSLALNEILNGSVATQEFRGSSMATAIAAGNLALIVQAWKQRTGAWPTFEEARAVLMSTARDANNDVYTQGAGLIDADAGVDVASGRSGAYVTPPDWQAGDYRGKEYVSFAGIIGRNGSNARTFTLHNFGDRPVQVSIGAQWFKQIGAQNYSFTSKDVSMDHGEFTVPDYVMRIDQDIPPDTDLLQVREAIPYPQFNPTGSLKLDARYNNWRIQLLNWTDLNKNDAFWQDTDNNDKVSVTYDSQGKLIGSEMDPLEVVRFSEGADIGPAQEARIGSPLKRKANGILLSFHHSSRLDAVRNTNLTVEASFWQQVNWDWITPDRTSLTIPPHGTADFRALMHVPQNAAPGMYEGRIVARYQDQRSGGQNQARSGDTQIVIPVSAAVATKETSFPFGIVDKPPLPMLYDNSRLFGFTNYRWQEEAGDWRFYWTDVQASDIPRGSSAYLLVDNRWQGARSDIDTIVLGPAEDCFSNGVDCSGRFQNFPGAPDIYGPYTLAPLGGSENTYVGSGRYRYRTSSGGPYEIVGVPVREGLHEILLHQVGVDGGSLDESISGAVGLATVSPSPLLPRPGRVSATITLTSHLALGQFVGASFGLSQPVSSTETIHQDDPGRPSTASFTRTLMLSHAGEVTISTSGRRETDIDLYLLGPDGVVIAQSTLRGSNEEIHLSLPTDGTYTILVHGYDVPGGVDTFNLTVDAVQGSDITTSRLPVAIPAQGSAAITVTWNTIGKAPGAYKGLLVMGPKDAPFLFKVPIVVTVP